MNKNDGVPDPAHVLLIPTAMSWIWDTEVDDLPVKSEQKRPEPRCVAVRHPPAAVSTTARAVIARKGLERSKNSLRIPLRWLTSLLVSIDEKSKDS